MSQETPTIPASIPRLEGQVPHSPPGWSLTPEGAAVHRAERTAVIADVHLGYEWARAARGDMVPPHSLAETLAKLARLLTRIPIARLVVAGDLVETPRPCPRTARDLRSLVDWLNVRGVTLLWLMGDHDPRSLPTSFDPRPSAQTCDVAGWTIAHGNRPLTARRVVRGHLHPVLRAAGVTVPCFLVSPETILLPAFSPNAAGLPVNGHARAERLGAADLHCLACVGDDLLDFGPIATLNSRLAGQGRRPTPSTARPTHTRMSRFR